MPLTFIAALIVLLPFCASAAIIRSPISLVPAAPTAVAPAETAAPLLASPATLAAFAMPLIAASALSAAMPASAAPVASVPVAAAASDKNSPSPAPHKDVSVNFDGARIALPKDIRRLAEMIRWTPELTDRLILKMPKVEAHLHLDGALSPKTIQYLAQRQHHAPLSTKTLDEIAGLSVVNKPQDSLEEVLKAFGVVYPLLHTTDAVETAAYEVMREAARQHIRYVEVRFAPALQAQGAFTMKKALDAALEGLRRGERDFNVPGSGVIICLIRPFSFVSRQKNEAMLDLAIEYRYKGVVGIDLAGNEAAQPLSDFAPLYRKAKEAGLHLTAHAGEVPGSQDLETALDLGVDRLGHATLLNQKPALLAEVRRRSISIEVNLTSNLITSATKKISEHPAKKWYALGIPIAPSTDDPGVFGIDLNHEYQLFWQELGFGPVDILNLAFQGIDALFLPEARKAELRARFARETTSLLESLKSNP